MPRCYSHAARKSEAVSAVFTADVIDNLFHAVSAIMADWPVASAEEVIVPVMRCLGNAAAQGWWLVVCPFVGLFVRLLVCVSVCLFALLVCLCVCVCVCVCVSFVCSKPLGPMQALLGTAQPHHFPRLISFLVGMLHACAGVFPFNDPALIGLLCELLQYPSKCASLCTPQCTSLAFTITHPCSLSPCPPPFYLLLKGRSCWRQHGLWAMLLVSDTDTDTDTLTDTDAHTETHPYTHRRTT